MWKGEGEGNLVSLKFMRFLKGYVDPGKGKSREMKLSLGSLCKPNIGYMLFLVVFQI